MINPVNTSALSVSKLIDSSSSAQSTKNTISLYQSATSTNSKVQSSQDSVALKFSLQSSLQDLQYSMTTVYDQIKSQMSRRFEISSSNLTDETTVQDQPTTDSSAQQLMDYFSPENTAQRILGFATGFFSAYQGNHQNATDEQNVNQFTSLMSDAIQKGFDQAEKTLGNYDNLGEIGKNIKKTYNLVMQGLEEYRKENLNDLGIVPEDSSSSTSDILLDDTSSTTDVNLLG